MTDRSSGAQELSLGRMRVVPVGVAFADPTVAPVYEQLRALRPGDFTRRFGSRSLGGMH